MHLMLSEGFNLHGLKCPRTNVQGQIGDVYAFVFQSAQQGSVEVQAGCGCSHRARYASVHCLIAFNVFIFCFAADIWWQRYCPLIVQQSCQAGAVNPLDYKKLSLPADHFQLSAPGRSQQRTSTWCFTGSKLRHCRFFVSEALYQNFYTSASLGFLREQSRCKHSRIVNHQKISRTQALNKIAKACADKRSIIGWQNEQTAIAASSGRRLGNELRGQLIIEFTYLNHK